MSFEKFYPELANWIEMGEDKYSNSMLRILDQGDLVWEDNDSESLE